MRSIIEDRRVQVGLIVIGLPLAVAGGFIGMEPPAKPWWQEVIGLTIAALGAALAGTGLGFMSTPWACPAE